MGVGNVILTTIMYLVIAGIVFTVISRLSRRPVRVFQYVAAVVLVLSFFQPFSIDAPGDMIAVLLLMHVLSAIVGVWVMTRVATS